ncbi:MAG: T9SS type A sorting domain-containing protein [Bacteroidetes bacterium]|nr:T9SS type A sorting domain-containing protein [Bacteroidota bacterium]
MKKVFFSIIFVLFIDVANAQIDSIMYGVSADPPNSIISLSKIDPVTGQVSQISPTSYPYSSSNIGRTIDPIKKIYYQPVDSVLLAFSLTTGELLSIKLITGITNSTFTSINFNCPDSTLYGIAINTVSGEKRLARIDPNSGIVYVISPQPLPNTINVLSGNAINPYNSRYYYVSTNKKIMGIDLATGLVVSSPDIVMSSGTFGPIVLDCNDTILFGLAGDATNGRKFSKIDPETGNITYISSTTVANAIYADMATLDPFKHVYYFKRVDDKLIGVSTQTGQIVTDPTIQPISGTGFFNLFYNHPCMVSYPVGIEPSIKNQTIIEVYPNPVNDWFFIEPHSSKIDNIEIFSLLGNKIKTFVYSSNEIIKVNIKNLDKGIYVLKITGDRFMESRSIVKF